MSSNSEIRTIQFMQGVIVDLPSNILDGTGSKVVINNATNASTGLQFRDDVYREVIIPYSIKRRTDATALAGDVLIEKGQIRLTANPDAASLANRWILDHETQKDEGISTGVTLSILVTNDAGVAVVDLLYTSTNLAGANHESFMSYALTSFVF